ncbi:hypothetical protein ACFYT3_32365 [Nocardia amikacinitolerans]|uniref:hypothetical protein n=1 Tax=Nocardia amikacinitolerans TaxID=756689 RepID=UPI00369B8D8C
MPIAQWRRKLGRFTAYGALALVILLPVVFIGLVIRAKLNPPPEMRHATATEVTGYETVSTEKNDLSGGSVVEKVFIGPVVDRPQDRIVSPGATIHDMGRPGQASAYWLVYGDYADGCHISVHRVVGGEPLRIVSNLSDSQREEVLRGEKLVLVAKFTCGEG